MQRKRIKQSEWKTYDLHPLLCMRNTSTSELEEFRERVKQLPKGTGFSHLLHKLGHASSPEAFSTLPLTPRSVHCLIKQKLSSMPLPPTFDILQKLGEEFISDITPNNQQKYDIKKATCLQANCVYWHEECYCSSSALKFGAVVKCWSDVRKSTASYLLRSFLLYSHLKVHIHHNFNDYFLLVLKRIIRYSDYSFEIVIFKSFETN